MDCRRLQYTLMIMPNEKYTRVVQACTTRALGGGVLTNIPDRHDFVAKMVDDFDGNFASAWFDKWM